MRKIFATILTLAFILSGTISAYAAGVVVNVHAGSAGKQVLVRNWNRYQGNRYATTNNYNLAYFGGTSTGNNWFDWKDNRGIWHPGTWKWVPWYGAYVNLYW